LPAKCPLHTYQLVVKCPRCRASLIPMHQPYHGEDIIDVAIQVFPISDAQRDRVPKEICRFLVLAKELQEHIAQSTEARAHCLRDLRVAELNYKATSHTSVTRLAARIRSPARTCHRERA